MIRDAELARLVAEQLGSAVSGVVRQDGPAEVNHVFRVATRDGDWIVRFPRDLNDRGDFSGEAWCLRRFWDGDIPVPEFVGEGEVMGIAFIAYRFVAGSNGDSHRTPELWRQLGKYARVINQTPFDESAPASMFPRFGRDPAQNWRAHIDYNLAQLTPHDSLIELGVYTLAQHDLLRSVVERLAERVSSFGISHGDLAPRNIILRPGASPFVIDWGSASVGPSPHLDLMRIWGNSVDEGFTAADFAAFAEGYDVRPEELLTDLEAMQVLNALDIVRWAIDRRPDVLEEKIRSSKTTIQTFWQARA